MGKKSHFKVFGRDFNGKDEASITIDKERDMFIVRPKHFHTTYELPLSAVANMVIYSVIRANIDAKKREKKAKRKMF
jgi:hypothetical protein